VLRPIVDPMGLPHKAGKEVLVERSHVSSKEHPTDLASNGIGFDNYERPGDEESVEPTMSKQDGGTPRPNQHPRHDSASTSCVTIHRKHLGRDSPSECLVVVKPIFHRHKAGGEVLLRRRARGSESLNG
jgi:hypothetical protein